MLTKNLTATWIGILILAAAVVMAAWPDRAENSSPSQSAAVVQTATVEETTTGRSVSLSGVTRAESSAVLSFTVAARIDSLPVKVGQHVRAGEILTTLDRHQFELAVDAAAASLAEVEVRLEQALRDELRVRQLSDARAATDEELEKTASATRSLEAARLLLNTRHNDALRLLAESELRAPFAGTVTTRYRQAGEWASPGAPVVELVGDEDVEVIVDAPETVVFDLKVGQEVVVSLPLSNRSVPGVIKSVAASGAGSGRLFPVVISIGTGAGVRAGMAAEILVQTNREPVPTVPLEAVLNPGSSLPSVFRVDSERVSQIAVKLGPMLGDRVVFESAQLAVGDLVVIAGHTSLADGDEVEVRR